MRFPAILLLGIILLAGCKPDLPTQTAAEDQPTEVVEQCVVQEWRSISTSLPNANLLAWSHDGRSLAFLAPGETTSYNMGDLHIAVGPDFAETTRLYSNVTGGILWSPDDTSIAFNAYRINQRVYTSFIQSVDKSSLVDLFPVEEGNPEGSSRLRTTIDWLSNQRLLAVSACGNRCLAPVVYSLASQTSTPLTVPAKEEISSSLPAGSGMVITAGGYYSVLGVLPEGEETPLWIAADETGDPVWESLFTFFPGWMIDPSRIYYLKQPYNAEIPPELWVRNQTTGEDTRLFGGVVQAVLSPQKDRIAFISLGRAAYDDQNVFRDFIPNPRQANRVGVGIYDLETGKLLSLQDLGETTTKYIWQNPFLAMFTPAWSPDGKWLIYPDRFSNAWILTPASEKTAQINLSDQSIIEVQWSPDGKKVAALLSNSRLVLLETACLK